MTVLLNIAPQEPTRYELEWRTNVLRSLDGTEQRAALSLRPQWRLDYDFSLDNAEYRRLRTWLFNNTAEQFVIPLWAEGQKFDPVSSGVGSLTGDFEFFDLVNQQDEVYLRAPDGTDEYLSVTAIDDTTITLNGTTANAYPEGSRVFPALRCYLEDGSRTRKQPRSLSEWNMRARATKPRQSQGRGALVNTYQSLTILDRRPLSDAESFDAGLEYQDVGTFVGVTASEEWAQVGRGHRFSGHGRQDRQFFRKFIDTVVGMREPFYLSTYRKDLVLTDTPAQGNSFILVEKDPAYNTEWWDHAGHKDIELEDSAGQLIRRRVNSIIVNPSNLSLNIDSPLPVGDYSTGNRVSFLELCRLGSDVVRFEDHVRHVYVDLVIQAVAA